MRPTPVPRDNKFFPGGMASLGKDGTWCEAECFAYPHGGPTRRCRAICAVDNVMRVVFVGIPDTYFSIPGYAKIKGKRVRGYVTLNDDVYMFHVSKHQKD